MSIEELTTPELDRLLDASGPPTSDLTETGRAELSRLVTSARAAHVALPRRRRRVAAIAVAGIVLGAGSMAAAASSALDWVPWAGNADRAETFTSPRGQSCDALFRLVHDEKLRSSNPAAHAELVSFPASFEPTPEAIETEARRLSSSGATIYETGESVILGTLFSADDIERMARENVIGNALNSRAESLGISGLADLEGESECND